MRSGIRLGGKRQSKYNAHKTEVDGIVFHSAKEARRYGELKLLEKAGEISGLKLQHAYVLNAPRIYVPGAAGLVTPRPLAVLGKYIADFIYYDQRNGFVVEDVKGFKTPLYKWKKRHVEAQYGIVIREI
jgi:uncharacterized protein DUF1064